APRNLFERETLQAHIWLDAAPLQCVPGGVALCGLLPSPHTVTRERSSPDRSRFSWSEAALVPLSAILRSMSRETNAAKSGSALPTSSRARRCRLLQSSLVTQLKLQAALDELAKAPTQPMTKPNEWIERNEAGSIRFE